MRLGYGNALGTSAGRELGEVQGSVKNFVPWRVQSLESWMPGVCEYGSMRQGKGNIRGGEWTCVVIYGEMGGRSFVVIYIICFCRYRWLIECSQLYSQCSQLPYIASQAIFLLLYLLGFSCRRRLIFSFFKKNRVFSSLYCSLYFSCSLSC